MNFDKNLYATATKEERAEMSADMLTELLKAAGGSVGKAIRLVEKQHLPKKIRSVKKFLLRTLRMYKRWNEGRAIYKKGEVFVR